MNVYNEITAFNDVRVHDDHGQVRQTIVDGVLHDVDGHLFSGIVVLLFREKLQSSRGRFAGLVTVDGHCVVRVYVLDWLRSDTVHNHRGNILVGSKCIQYILKIYENEIFTPI